MPKRKVDAAPNADVLGWSWAEGAATTAGDFGDPTATSDYAVCVYGGAPGSERLVYEVAVPASSFWSARPRARGYRYADRTGGERGVRRLVLKSGTAGASEISVRATGAGFFRSSFAVPTPVTAQAVDLASGTCFESAFGASEVQTSDTRTFKARSPM